MPGGAEFIPGVGYAGGFQTDKNDGKDAETRCGKCDPRKMSKSLTASSVGLAVTVLGREIRSNRSSA